ncbi:hypothetical protein AWN90_32155 [Nocardia terpenica]|uniref:Dioxygenase n=1 Tax=Nocardia terpenica TaxID=455432 RepID=A0A164N7E7_9NOCA|nr:hypothetical protein AWN90_32155 [Nocardia terpenica]
MTSDDDVPLHLAGNNAPVTEEVTVGPSEVVGVIPEELNGVYLRNGPNPRTGWSPHWFAGDGMVHAVALSGGKACWYRNRYVRTPLYRHGGQSRFALAVDPVTGQVDYRVTTANTHVVAHAGRLLALEEGGLPYEITPELETVGPFTFGGALQAPMTAHPKRCPRTGELLFFGYRVRPPYLTYYRAAPTGELLLAQVVPIPRAVMMHDFAITDRHAIFMDLPVVFDPRAGVGGLPWRWDDDHRARFGVIARGGGPVRWFDIEPCYVWHTMNACEGDGAITVTGCRVPTLWRAGPDDLAGGLPRLYQWRLEPATGRVVEQPLDDVPIEYPRVADADVGQRYRYGYVTSFALEPVPERSQIYRYDFTDRTSRRAHRLPAGHTCSEAVFVPRPGAGDDNGYLIAFAHNHFRGTSYLLILDATDLTAPPVAEVHLPVRVPAGFHGTWLPDH